MNTFLFDLDGTLLPMDQDEFINIYFRGIAKKMIPYGIDPKALVDTIMEGTHAMIKNDGSMFNCERFWKTASNVFGKNVLEYENIFLDYYENEFQRTKEATTQNPLAKECINSLINKGYRVILATNPLFPRVATYSRIKWAGLKPEDFEWITTYENSSYCKPNLKYFEEILHNLNLTPNQCIMIGNDVSDDMVASKIGMDTFLVTDCLINHVNEDISQYKNGSLSDLLDFISGLPAIK